MESLNEHSCNGFKLKNSLYTVLRPETEGSRFESGH